MRLFLDVERGLMMINFIYLHVVSRAVYKGPPISLRLARSRDFRQHWAVDTLRSTAPTGNDSAAMAKADSADFTITLN